MLRNHFKIFKFVIPFLLFCVHSSFEVADKILASERVTDFGEWGGWEYCPPNTYVVGLELKIEELKSGDNTGLNAIRLFCARVEDTTKVVKIITSTEGPAGTYKGPRFCETSLAKGFLFIAEEKLSGDLIGASNLKLLCSNDVEVEGGGGDLNFGKEYLPKRCRRFQAICGLRTRVDTRNGGNTGQI